MLSIGPTLETERLLLRPPCADDFTAYTAFMANERTARFLGGVQTSSAAWRGWATITGAWVLQGFSMFSFIEKATGRWVGRGGPWMPSGWPGTEVGWGVIEEAQGKGYAKEASTAALDWAFDALGWSEVIHCIDPENAASIGVATALGSRLQQSGVSAPAPLVATWDLYGQSRAEWRARRTQG